MKLLYVTDQSLFHDNLITSQRKFYS